MDVINFREFIDTLANEVIIGKAIPREADINILVLGLEGHGKSNFAILSAYELHKQLEKQLYVFQPFRNITFTEFDFMSVANLRKQIIVFDEAGAVMNTFGGRRKDSIYCLLTLLLGRVNQNIYFYCVPHFRWLDPYLREHRTICWILVDRDHAYLYTGIEKIHEILNHDWANIYQIPQKIEPDAIIEEIPFCGKVNPQLWATYKQVKILMKDILFLCHTLNIDIATLLCMLKIPKHIKDWRLSNDYFTPEKTKRIKAIINTNPTVGEKLNMFYHNKQIRELLELKFGINLQVKEVVEYPFTVF